MAESSDESQRETGDADGASDPATRGGDESVETESDAEAAAADRAASAGEDATDADLEALREEVDDKYDFENFSPSDMADMSAREWEAAFDPETWITGDELLGRVERDLRSRIARREVFAVLERAEDPDRVVAYSDEGWAIVYPDGSVEGEGTVLRDVKPTIALCSMDSYEVSEPPEAYELPSPEEVQAGTGEFGNNVMQLIAAAQVLAGLGILGIWLFTGLIPSPQNTTNLLVPVLAVFFLGIGLLLFFVVANARLSDRFRAEEYRDRLRAAGITDGDAGITDEDRPEFLPFEAVVETTVDEDGLPAEPSETAGDDEPDSDEPDSGDSDSDDPDDDETAGESWA